MTEQEKRFQRACKRCCRPKNVGEACTKFGMQLLRVLGVDERMDPEMRRLVRLIPRPTGWRKRIFLKLRKTVFKELTQEKIKGRSGHFILGNARGAFANVKYALQDVANNPDEKKLFIKAFGYSPDLNDYKLPKKSRPRTEPKKDLKPITPSQLEDYSEGMRRGAKAFFGDDLKPPLNRNTTDIYISLLLLSDIVRAAPNIYALWDFFGKYELDEFKHSPESLEKICRRVGIPLALKSAPRKNPGQSKSRVSGQ